MKREDKSVEVLKSDARSNVRKAAIGVGVAIVNEGVSLMEYNPISDINEYGAGVATTLAIYYGIKAIRDKRAANRLEAAINPSGTPA
jgi:hypothetical protein